MEADLLVSECSGSLPGSCPASRAEVSWEDWAVVHLAWPLAAQAVLVVVFRAVLQPGYRWSYRRGSSFTRWLAKTYTGTSDRQAKRPFFIMAIFAADMAACTVAVVLWLYHTYERSTSTVSRIMLLVAALVHVAASTASHLRSECRVGSILRLRSWVDAFTIVPTLHLLWHQDGSGSGVEWLSLHWMRTASVIEDFQEIQGLSYRAKHTGVVAQMVVLLVLRITCLIVTMAGTIFTSEVLGELPFFDYLLADRYIISPAGDRISPTQMCYWIVVSITTVGYGDFAPRTVIGRFFTSVFIVAGVLYLFMVQVEFMKAWAEIHEGSGVYQAKPRKRGSLQRHVVVVLCTRRRAVHFSSMLAGFLREILHTERSHEWPDVVIFSRTPWDVAGDGEESQGSTFDDFLRAEGLSASVRRRVLFIVGKLSSKADMERAAIGQSLAFLLADVASETPDREDEDNLFTAVLMRQFFPDAQLRVMLLRPQSKELAVQAGIEISRCFSLQELKANILAQNVRCHGLVPMITGMLLSVDVREEARGLLRASGRGTGAPDRSTHDGAAPEEAHGSPPVSPHYEARPSAYSGSSSSRSSSSAGPGVGPRLSGSMRSRASTQSASSVASSIRAGQRALWTRFRDSSAWKEKVSPWVLDYIEGLQRSVFGFELSEDLAGLSFGEIATAVFSRTGAIVFATFVNCQLLICPQDVSEAEERQIFFAVAKDESTLKGCRTAEFPADNWRRSLLMARHLERRKTRQGPHVSASKLLGHSLRRAMVWRSGRFTPEPGAISRQQSPLSLPYTPMAPINGGAPLQREMGSSLESVHSYGGGREVSLREQQRRLQHLRSQLAHTGEELVVVIVCQGEVWQQVRTFVASLCAPHLPDRRPIVVFAPTKMPRQLLDDDLDGQVLVVEGNCTKVKSLIEAGVLEASAVVVMSGQAPAAEGRETLHQDSRIVLCAQILECWCGMSGHEVYATYELQHSGSVRKLPKILQKSFASMEDLLSGRPHDYHVGQEPDTAAAGERRFSSIASANSSQSGASSAAEFTEPEGGVTDTRSRGDARTRDADESISAMYHPRFAAGQIFTPELWGAMLGYMYYMPAIIELVEALVMPHKREQHAYPWQICVPTAHVGRKFGELFSDLALEGIQTRLAAAEAQAPPGAGAGPGPREEDEVYSLGPAVALALHRRREETLSLAPGTGGHNYTILAPPPSTRLRADDWVVVLGSAAFGRHMCRAGLLRGSGEAAHRADGDEL